MQQLTHFSSTARICVIQKLVIFKILRDNCTLIDACYQFFSFKYDEKHFMHIYIYICENCLVSIFRLQIEIQTPIFVVRLNPGLKRVETCNTSTRSSMVAL